MMRRAINGAARATGRVSAGSDRKIPKRHGTVLPGPSSRKSVSPATLVVLVPADTCQRERDTQIWGFRQSTQAFRRCQRYKRRRRVARGLARFWLSADLKTRFQEPYRQLRVSQSAGRRLGRTEISVPNASLTERKAHCRTTDISHRRQQEAKQLSATTKQTEARQGRLALPPFAETLRWQQFRLHTNWESIVALSLAWQAQSYLPFELLPAIVLAANRTPPSIHDKRGTV